MRRRTQWMAAFVVTASCASGHKPDPLGALYVGKDEGTNRQVDIAARQNAAGILAYRAGRFAEATSKFREAVARVAEPPYFINLCMSLVREDKLPEANLACDATTRMESTAEQRAHAERLLSHISLEASRRGISIFIPHGNPPAPQDPTE